jgi:hypothetical protein
MCHASRSAVGCTALCTRPCTALCTRSLHCSPRRPPPAQIGLASLSVGQPCCLAALRRALVSRTLPARPSQAAEGAEGAAVAEGAEVAAGATGAEGAEVAALSLRPPPPRLLTAERPFVNDPPPRRTGPAESTGAAAAGAAVAAQWRPCSNSLLWRAGAATGGGPAANLEAINGMAGVRLGANTKGGVSPKHRAAACKALLLRRFLQVCAALPADALLPPLRALPPLSERSYRELKQASVAYQQRRASLLGLEGFRDWICAPESCEAFTDAAGAVPAGDAPPRATT